MTNYDVSSVPYAGSTPPGNTSTRIGRAPVPIEMQYAIENLQVVNNHVYFKGYLRLFWNDPRLRWDLFVPARPSFESVVTLRSSDDIWTPDAYL